MTSFRFYHAADIHLDSPLIGLSGIEGSIGERIRSAPRAAFKKLIEQVIRDEVDFVVIAGDLYDGPWRDYNTGLFFAQQMGRLNKVGIPVFLLHGNHDAENQITNRLTLPDNVNVFAARTAETFNLEELNVALHGQSFRERAVTENLVPGYPAPRKEFFNIGVLHTALDTGGGVHANYAPCSLSELVEKGYDYWALGHVHAAKVLHERPHVVFPGNLQGRHIRETGPKGANLVTVKDGEVIEVEQQSVDVVRWLKLDIDVETADSTLDVIDRIQRNLNQSIKETEGRTLCVRLVLVGRTNLHSELVSDIEHLRAEARSAALGLGDEAAWVERVDVCTTPVIDDATLAAREDAVGDLQRMLKEALQDEDLLEELKSNISQLTARLPHGLKDEVEDDILRTAVEGDYAALIKEVTPYLNARLLADDT